MASKTIPTTAATREEVAKSAGRVFWWAIAIWVSFCLVYQAVDANWVTLTTRQPVATDIDEALFLRHVAMHPTLLSTLWWWHGNWIDHDYPRYWRPLTMLGYWIEDHAFGPQYLGGWRAAELTFNFLFIATLATFTYSVTRSRLATLLTTALFTYFAPFLLLKPIAQAATFQTLYNTPGALTIIQQHWEDQPEPWTGTCLLGMMLAIGARRWWAALLLATAAVCFKESGWIAFPLAGMMLWYTRQFQAVPRRVWIAAVCSVAVLVALRAGAGHAVMFPVHAHSNGSWLNRYAHVVIDANLYQLVTPMWPVPILGFVLAALPRLRPLPFIARAFVAICATFTAAAALGWSTQSGVIIGLVNLIGSPTGLAAVLGSVIYAWVVITSLRDPSVRRLALLLCAAILLTALPSCFVLQPNNHMLYVTSGLQSVLVATLTAAALRAVAGALRTPGRVARTA